MNKEQFFGRCIGMPFKVKDFPQIQTVAGIRGHRLFATHQAPTDYSFIDILHCQIIARRISQMTDEENREHRKLQSCRHLGQGVAMGEEDYTYFDTEESINYKYDIGVFPDVYFDEKKWCVEEKK